MPHAEYPVDIRGHNGAEPTEKGTDPSPEPLAVAFIGPLVVEPTESDICHAMRPLSAVTGRFTATKPTGYGTSPFQKRSAVGFGRLSVLRPTDIDASHSLRPLNVGTRWFPTRQSTENGTDLVERPVGGGTRRFRAADSPMPHSHDPCDMCHPLH